MKNTIDSIHPHGGLKYGEMLVLGGRQTGKSHLNAHLANLRDKFYNRPVTNMTASEGRIHGSRFYCVGPEGGNWFRMEEWCKAQMGEPGSVWDIPVTARWLANDRKFWFRSEADRTMFILKWR